jgi:cobalt-precorrin-5B (C1)-methyltransferase
LGSGADLAAEVRRANTAMEALDLARAAHLPLADWVAARARKVAMAEADHHVDVELLIYDRAGALVGRAGFER